MPNRTSEQERAAGQGLAFHRGARVALALRDPHGRGRELPGAGLPAFPADACGNGCDSDGGGSCAVGQRVRRSVLQPRAGVVLGAGTKPLVGRHSRGRHRGAHRTARRSPAVRAHGRPAGGLALTAAPATPAGPLNLSGRRGCADLPQRPCAWSTPKLAHVAWLPSGGRLRVTDRESGDRHAEQPPSPANEVTGGQSIHQATEVSTKAATAKKSASSQRFAGAPGGQAGGRTAGAPGAQPDLRDPGHRAGGAHRRRAGDRQGRRRRSARAPLDQASPPAGTPIPAATLAKLQSVPISTLTAAPTSGIVTTPQSANGSSLVAEGKPELLFIGAEFCPHCAAERWPMYIALSKFGTFNPQPGRIHSANDDGDVPTLTFYGTTYSSPYFTFNPVEVYTNKPRGQRLHAPADADPGATHAVAEHQRRHVPVRRLRREEGASLGPVPVHPAGEPAFLRCGSPGGQQLDGHRGDIDASAAQLVTTICGSLSNHEARLVCTAVHGG